MGEKIFHELQFIPETLFFFLNLVHEKPSGTASNCKHCSLKNTRRYDKKNITMYGTVMSRDLDIQAVFWIRNELARIRILLYRSFRIRILLFEPVPPYNWKIKWTKWDWCKIYRAFKRFFTETLTYASDHFAEIFEKIIQIFLVKEVRSGSYMVTKFQIRPDPQHCSKVPRTYFSIQCAGYG